MKFADLDHQWMDWPVCCLRTLISIPTSNFAFNPPQLYHKTFELRKWTFKSANRISDLDDQWTESLRCSFRTCISTPLDTLLSTQDDFTTKPPSWVSNTSYLVSKMRISTIAGQNDLVVAWGGPLQLYQQQTLQHRTSLSQNRWFE